MKMFLHASRGIWRAVKTERNMRIHLAAVFYLIIAGIFLDFYYWEWAIAALACGLVIGAELLNTALERLCDTVEPGCSPAVKIIKDTAAGAVLACAAAALCAGAALIGKGFVYWLEYWEFSDLVALPDLFIEFWAGAAALPFWIWFILRPSKRK